MDVDTVLEYLSKIDMSNLRVTHHFETRANERKNDIHPDVNGIYDVIFNEKPVGILKQNEDTFKLYYNLSENHDLIIIISVKSPNPIIINLITCFLVDSKKRRRENASGLSGE